MRRSIAIVLALLVTLPAAAGVAGAQAENGGVDCTFPVSATDATGTNVTVEEEPQRVVVLSHSTAQTMWEIGAQDKVVGLPIDQYSSYLEGREGKTDVVDEQSQPVTEKVVAANPDLVIAGNNIQPDAVNATRAAVGDDVPVYRAQEAVSLDAVSNKTERIGQLVGEFDAAAQVAADTRTTVAAMSSAVEGEDRPTVYYAMGGGWTAGTTTFIGNLIEAAGGRNVAEAANITGYGPISQEIIADEDPDWIVVNEGMPVPQTAAVNESTAVAEDQILKVNANFLNQPGPRVTEPLGEMAGAFHPEAYDPNATGNATAVEPASCAGDVGTPQTTTTSDDGTSGTGTTAAGPESTTAAGGPGFTVALGLAGLLGAVALLGRRD